jgi:hypothetical protein
MLISNLPPNFRLHSASFICAERTPTACSTGREVVGHDGDVLGWEMAGDPQDGIALLPSDDTGFRIRFLPTQEQKAGQNQVHFDLTSTSLEDQQQTVARSLGRGARHIDIGQRPEEGHVVLADPQGNEFLRHRAGQQLPAS